MADNLSIDRRTSALLVARAIRAHRGALVRRRTPAHQRRTQAEGRWTAGRDGGQGELYALARLGAPAGALSWELRTSTSLARLQRDQGRIVEARSLLQSVYDRFSEGFQTADLKTAKEYLDSW
jgi:predicted ATPase